MITWKWISVLACSVVSVTAMAITPQQSVDDFVFAPIIPAIDNTANTRIDWSSLCLPGQTLMDFSGCSPDCNATPFLFTCSTIFRLGQTEQLTNIPLPYLSNGVIVFQLPMTEIPTTAKLNVVLNQQPNGYGYMCEIYNSNGTPALIWDTVTTAFTSIINMDPNTVAPPFKSDNFINSVSQNTLGKGYWYTNLNNPLYLVCLGYQVVEGTNTLQSHRACGGNGSTCVTYTLQ